ncbi:MAG: oligoendopeptidase F [Lachnospiraceae bacterium]
MSKVVKRSEADEKYMWNMKDMYENDGLWEDDVKEAESLINGMPAYIKVMDESPKNLLSLLEYDTEISKKLEKIYVYANQKSHEDMGESKYQDMAGRAQNLMVKYQMQSAPVTPAIMKIGRKKISEYTEADNNPNGLPLYKRYFELIFRKEEHILDADKEELLAGVNDLSETPSDIFAMFNNADIRFDDITDKNGESHQLTYGKYTAYLRSKDRTLRENAFKKLYEKYGNYRNTLAAAYRGNLKQHNFYAKVRKYDSGMQYSLSDANIPVRVYNSLIDATHENIGLLHRYISLRKKVMDVSELHMYDLYVPMVSDVNMNIDYEEAKQIVIKGLAPLGEDYINELKGGLSGGWIDVYENEGKRTGAYSWGAYGTHPYVLLNHQNDLNSVFTLAHEMGHALHTYYSDANQPYIYAGYKIFVAEVASTCNEALLVNYLIKNSKSENEKKYLINYFLEQFRTTFFRQTMFAEFEKITHEKCAAGQTLTADVLCGIYKELNAFYFGEDAVIDDEIALEWARIPHFYTPFYVYQYATGFAAAVSISSAILSGNEDVLLGYRTFLKSGGSLDPIDLLKLCGVDMLTPEPVNEAMKVFESLLNQFSE